LLGFALLAAACLLGLAIATQLPEAIVALERTQVLDVDIDHGIRSTLGLSQWPRLVSRLALLALLTLLSSGLAVLLISRRRAGAAHMARAVLGCLGLLTALLLLGLAFATNDWNRVAQYLAAEQFGFALEAVVGRGGEFMVPLVAAGITFLGSMLLLCWPAPRQTIEAAPPIMKAPVP
jgi:hypothetical protein